MKKQAEHKKQELIEIALGQFLSQGYEKTSIRSILKEAKGEIGMFYHYFKSKNQIYQLALEEYNQRFLHQMSQKMESKDDDPLAKLQSLPENAFASIKEYGPMLKARVNPEIATILLAQSLTAMVPILNKLILEGIEKRTWNPATKNTYLLSGFLLYGMSGIIHDKEIVDVNEKKQLIEQLLRVNLVF